MPDPRSGNESSSSASALQLAAQAIAAVVAVLGATGYIIALGAVVLWVRLGEAGFPRDVPLSTVSKQELLVIGAQALAVWVVLALVLLMLAVQLINTPGMGTHDVLVALAWGFLVSIGVLTIVDSKNHAAQWITVALGLSALLVAVAALLLRPPPPVWVTPLLSIAIGAAMPFLIRGLGGERGPTTTVVTAWVAFVLILVLLRHLMEMRTTLLATEAATAQLTPEGSPASPEPTEAKLRHSLLQRGRALRTGFWLRCLGVGVVALILLGAVAVASQFDRAKLFRAALVSLNTGRCVRGTYLARGNGRVVLGDQELFKPTSHVELKPRHENKVLVIPDNEILELQVLNPTKVGIRLKPVNCQKDKAVITPDGSGAESFRGPPGPGGATGATGPRGPRGDRGPAGRPGVQGSRGPRGEAGKQGAQGEVGPRGALGERGPGGLRGPKGDRGKPGHVAVVGNG